MCEIKNPKFLSTHSVLTSQRLLVSMSLPSRRTPERCRSLAPPKHSINDIKLNIMT